MTRTLMKTDKFLLMSQELRQNVTSVTMAKIQCIQYARHTVIQHSENSEDIVSCCYSLHQSISSQCICSVHILCT